MSKNVDRKNEALINENIKAEIVLVVDENGVQLGEMSPQSAMKIAEGKGLDLVCVAPNAQKPVCRFIDYSKYRYDQQRRAREAKKNQKIVSIKEIWLTPVISTNDFDTKLRNGIKFLNDGNKLKVTLRFNRRARMLNDVEGNSVILNQYMEKTTEIATVEQKPTLEGRSISMVLVPKKNKK